MRKDKIGQVSLLSISKSNLPSNENMQSENKSSIRKPVLNTKLEQKQQKIINNLVLQLNEKGKQINSFENLTKKLEKETLNLQTENNKLSQNIGKLQFELHEIEIQKKQIILTAQENRKNEVDAKLDLRNILKIQNWISEIKEIKNIFSENQNLSEQIYNSNGLIY